MQVSGKIASEYVSAIRASGMTIYDPIAIGDPELWIPTEDLEQLLDDGLRGLDVTGLPLKTRSKFIKQAVCKVLGYPVPSAFRKTPAKKESV